MASQSPWSLQNRPFKLYLLPGNHGGHRGAVTNRARETNRYGAGWQSLLRTQGKAGGSQDPHLPEGPLSEAFGT